MRKTLHGVWLFGVAALLPGYMAAATLGAVVLDHEGNPLEDAVVVATPLQGVASAPGATSDIVDQVNKEFVPSVKPVVAGTSISFPNKDNIRHHVYSFSEAKKFELPLYKGTPAKPVLFDKPGVVKLGCNIHDWMLGYIYVSASPYFGKTDAHGAVTIAQLPAGKFTVTAWHARLRGAESGTAQQIELKHDAQLATKFSLKVRREIRIRRAPTAAGGGYR
jgi:plastocyanin